ncbi:Signal transduction histidine kinase [hydrothermal vent metagenome]|uniref:Signal transduction histidine kinase n=1 Tax=hydrothermal vent metagenome TaxID=652676 RepID=A0A3B1AUT9_9ZZZZ
MQLEHPLGQDGNTEPLRILLIDDDEVDRMAARRALQATGIDTTLQEAMNTADGFAAAQHGDYDCILLDYNLPDGDGLTLLRKLRTAQIVTPVVMMTGQGDEELAVEMLHAGANDYLPKRKLKPEVLHHTLRSVMHIFQVESQRKAVQEQLAGTGARLQYLIDNSPAIIYSAVPSGDFKMTFVSENLLNVLGYEPHEMLDDMNFWIEHIHPDDRSALMQQLPRLLSNGGQQTHDYRFRHHDGHYLWMHDTMRLVCDKTGQPLELLGSLLDITERKKMEGALQQEKEEQQVLIQELHEAREQLLQNEKMAAIGQLAAGVAHEINNPIGYINSNLGTLKHYADNLIELTDLYQVAEMSFDGAHQEVLELIHSIKSRIDLDYIREDLPDLVRESQEGAERVRQIIQNLKEFSHVGEAEWQLADLHHGLDSTLNIVHNEIKYKAEICKEYGNLPQVECIASQINQVFMNILVNAAHAIEKQGTITLRTGCEDGEVWVQISDTGIGIPADKIKHIFEPFYTSKPVGVGTGLGLSLSYNIIKKHHGRLAVTSDVGTGTSFTVYLPIKRADEDQAEQSNTQPEEIPCGSGGDT